MILTSQQIGQRAIVVNGSPAAQQHTTYNATVGEILLEGEAITCTEYVLPPRGMVWVVSSEEFKLPPDVTGLATLRTTWTHNGILALNVGVIDPGWHGPLATALVNFSEKTFTVRKSEQFLRVIFHAHNPTSATTKRRDMKTYVTQIADKSARTANTFLNIKALGAEVVDQILTLPRWLTRLTTWGIAFAVVAAIIGLLAIFVPVGYGITTEWVSRETQIETLQREVELLKGRQVATERRLQSVSDRRAGSSRP